MNNPLKPNKKVRVAASDSTFAARNDDLTPAETSTGGIARLIEKHYANAASYQEFRELYQNAVDAGATKVEFGPASLFGVTSDTLKLAILDDGCGFTPEDLKRFSMVAEPETDGNFGLGVKISTASWNQNGILVISVNPANITPENPTGLIIGCFIKKNATVYGLLNDVEADKAHQHYFTLSDDEVLPVGGVTVDSSVASVIGTHGSLIVLLGNEDADTTLYGSPKVAKTGSTLQFAAAANYLNTRYLDIPIATTFHCWGQRKDEEGQWGSRNGSNGNGVRTITGISGLLKKESKVGGVMVPRVQYNSGVLDFPSCTVQVLVLAREDAGDVSDVKPFLGFLVDGEVVDKGHMNDMGNYGVPQVWRNRTFVLVSPKGNIEMDYTRSRLVTKDGLPLPNNVWQEEFKQPAELVALYASVRPTSDHSSISSNAYLTMKRFANFFQGMIPKMAKSDAGDGAGDGVDGRAPTGKPPVRRKKGTRVKPDIPGPVDGNSDSDRGKEQNGRRPGRGTAVTVTWSEASDISTSIWGVTTKSGASLVIELNRNFKPYQALLSGLVLDVLNNSDPLDAVTDVAESVFLRSTIYKATHFLSEANGDTTAIYQMTDPMTGKFVINSFFYGVISERDDIARELSVKHSIKLDNHSDAFVTNEPIQETCACGASFQREVKRGRPQKWCPTCVAKPFYDRTGSESLTNS